MTLYKEYGWSCTYIKELVKFETKGLMVGKLKVKLHLELMFLILWRIKLSLDRSYQFII